MSRNPEVPAFVKEQLVEAQKRFAVIQGQAEKTIKEWVARGQETAGHHREAHQGPRARGPQAGGVLSESPCSIQAAGVATQSQIKALTPGAVEVVQEGGRPGREEGRGQEQHPGVGPRDPP